MHPLPPPGGGSPGRLLRGTAPVAERARAVPPLLVLGGALVLTAGVWARLQRVEPYLGHDESVYAGQARAWLTGAPAAGWGAHRPVGLPLLGTLALRVSDGTGAVRAAGLVLALLTLVVVYAVAARVGSPPRAAVAVLVVLSGPTFLRRLPEFLDDIPAAGLLLLSAYLVLRSRRPGGRWALPAAAAVGVLAVLLRYGAAAGLLSIAGAGLLAWGPRVWLRAWPEVVAALAVLVGGLAPLAAYSHRVTGSWIGVLLQASVAAHRAYLGQGLVYYLQMFPYRLAGVLGAFVALAGLLGAGAAVRRLRRGAARGTDRERVFLAGAAGLDLVLLGVVAHGESRFALFTMITLIVVGVDVIARAAGPAARTVLAGTAVLALAATGGTAVLVARQVAGATATLDAVAAAAARARLAPVPAEPPAAAGTAGGVTGPRAARASLSRGLPAPPCLVITRRAVEAAWVTGCDAREPADVRSLPPDAVVYVVGFPRTPGWWWLAELRRIAPDRTWSAVAPGPGSVRPGSGSVAPGPGSVAPGSGSAAPGPAAPGSATGVPDPAVVMVSPPLPPRAS